MTDDAWAPLADRMAAARARTRMLVDMVEDVDLNRSLHPDFSPLRWHLGHIAAYEALWLIVNAGGGESPEPSYDVLFDPTRNPKAARVDLPSRGTLLEYGDRVREQSLAVLATASPDHPDPLLRDAFIGELVYEHECQHQEILCFLLQMLPHDRKRRPDGWKPTDAGASSGDDLMEIDGGPFLMGADGRSFAYDNEREAHVIDLAPYRIGRSPVTEADVARFVLSSGYDNDRLWSPEGWKWRLENRVDGPRDWSRDETGSLVVRTMFETRPPLAGVPVVGVSRHEAEAYARWLGRRLPTEAEWERAAVWDERTGRSRSYPWGEARPGLDQANIDGNGWGTRAVSDRGRSPAGCDDMAGQVWEWTATPFSPYPGFQAFPYEGYSQAWFDGEHAVLRGGSWATCGRLCRGTFRNWYHPHVREIFAGIRLAADGKASRSF